MTTNTCPRCLEAQECFTFRCHACLGVQHLHQKGWAEITVDVVALLTCPQCEALNAVRRPRAQVLAGRPVTQLPIQAELSL